MRRLVCIGRAAAAYGWSEVHNRMGWVNAEDAKRRADVWVTPPMPVIPVDTLDAGPAMKERNTDNCHIL